MNALLNPWLELSVLIPLLGAVWVGRERDPERARDRSLRVSGVALFCATAAWLLRGALPTASSLLGWRLFELDALSAPLLPLTSLLYLLVKVATLRTKIRRYSFAWALFSQSIISGALSCREPWAVIVFLSLGTLPPLLELSARGKPTRVYLVHIGAYVALMIAGWTVVTLEGSDGPHSLWAVLPILLAVWIRSGCVPLHCWMTDLFEHATFGTAMLFVAPMTGAYAAVRLLLPIASDEVLRFLGHVALFTAVYAAGMALVQKEARRFFCYLFLSHSALVYVGLDSATPLGLTGALCVWLSVTLGLTGFGLTLRAIEARHGRISLSGLHGYYGHTPLLAGCFLLTGLASVGFPGTVGFLGTELLIDGVVQAYPYVGVMIVLVSALNGIAVMQAYFTIFAGSRHVSTVSLRGRMRERVAVLMLAALIFGGALFPQTSVRSRHQAALELMSRRGTPVDPSAREHAWWNTPDDKPESVQHSLSRAPQRSEPSALRIRTVRGPSTRG